MNGIFFKLESLNPLVDFDASYGTYKCLTLLCSDIQDIIDTPTAKARGFCAPTLLEIYPTFRTPYCHNRFFRLFIHSKGCF